jgi:hypothetical protein
MSVKRIRTVATSVCGQGVRRRALSAACARVMSAVIAALIRLVCAPEGAVGARRARSEAGNRRTDASRRVRSL